MGDAEERPELPAGDHAVAVVVADVTHQLPEPGEHPVDLVGADAGAERPIPDLSYACCTVLEAVSEHGIKGVLPRLELLQVSRLQVVRLPQQRDDPLPVVVQLLHDAVHDLLALLTVQALTEGAQSSPDTRQRILQAFRRPQPALVDVLLLEDHALAELRHPRLVLPRAPVGQGRLHAGGAVAAARAGPAARQVLDRRPREAHARGAGRAECEGPGVQRRGARHGAPGGRGDM
mmetsp:Transcript_64197/g.180708  ORF Transcript_64197/g.180708 Transcript_64197/m.180708 type:complete len:233 (+) Transcript_64197:189-887(+)